MLNKADGAGYILDQGHQTALELCSKSIAKKKLCNKAIEAFSLYEKLDGTQESEDKQLI